MSNRVEVYTYGYHSLGQWILVGTCKLHLLGHSFHRSRHCRTGMVCILRLCQQSDQTHPYNEDRHKARKEIGSIGYGDWIVLNKLLIPRNWFRGILEDSDTLRSHRQVLDQCAVTLRFPVQCRWLTIWLCNRVLLHGPRYDPVWKVRSKDRFCWLCKDLAVRAQSSNFLIVGLNKPVFVSKVLASWCLITSLSVLTYSVLVVWPRPEQFQPIAD